jgi:CubicO group peptidase (beta-lactamase class C family)
MFAGHLQHKQLDLTYEISSTANRTGSVFDLASLTKALVTTPLLLTVLNKKAISLTSPVSQHLEAVCSPFHEKLKQMCWFDLLNHRSGLPAWRNFWIDQLPLKKFSYHENRQKIAQKLNYFSSDLVIDSPRYEYSDLGFIYLGLLLERIYGEDLAKIFYSFCLHELSIPSTHVFFSDLADRKKAVSTGFCALRNKNLLGEVHDENAAAMGEIAGHAGLWGSGEGLLAYIRALLRAKTGDLILKNCIENFDESLNKMQAAAGWMQFNYAFFKPKKVFGHLGFTGTGFWVLPEEQSFMVLLTNRTISGRRSDKMNQLRSDFCNIMNDYLNSQGQD